MLSTFSGGAIIVAVDASVSFKHGKVTSLRLVRDTTDKYTNRVYSLCMSLFNSSIPGLSIREWCRSPFGHQKSKRCTFPVTDDAGCSI